MTLESTMLAMGAEAKAAAAALRLATADQRSAAISAIARHIRADAPDILAANAADVADATALIDRLRLDEARLEGIASAIDDIAALPDPVGKVVDEWDRPNGLHIRRVRTPIGVIGMIYESRPNVTADAAAIALRSGNAIILRSGSDAFRSSAAIQRSITAALAEAGLPTACVQSVPTPDRAAVGMLLSGLGGTVDLIIPRGGKALVQRVQDEARVPVLGHLEGINHSYVHRSADPDMAIAVVRNAKLRRVSVCGATETLLIDREIAPSLLPRLVDALEGCEWRGDDAARSIVAMDKATDEDWTSEYLAPILAVRTVDGVDEAIDHIGRYGTGHTEAIIAEDEVAARHFLNRVDSAIVMWNASTQYADGGEFGFGAEIGIATGRLHARGPVGPEQLTSFKYEVIGTGQTRP